MEMGTLTPSRAVAQRRSLAYCLGSYPPGTSCCFRSERRLAVAHRALLVDDGDGHLDAIARGRPETLAGVLLGVVPAGHFLLFQERGFSAAGIVIEDAGGRDQALVVVAVGGGFVLGRAAGED